MPIEEFRAKLEENFDLEQIPEGTSSEVKALHEFSVFMEGKWHKMTLKAGRLDTSTPVSQLDSQILTELVFNPIVGITDLKNDDRIDFVGGIRGHKELERRCNEDCVVAFALCAVDIDDLLEVADAQLIMPPKSTWFEPKPRSGFVVRVFE